MLPAVSDIEFVRGDTFSKFGRVRTKVWDSTSQTYIPGPYRDLTGWTGLAQVRPDVDSATILFTFNITLGNQTTAPGSFFISATPAMTKDLNVLAGVYDLQWTTNTGEIFTYVGGKVTLKKDVSKAGA